MTKDVRQQNRGYLEKWRATRGDKKLRGWKHEHVQGFITKLATPHQQRNNLRTLRHFARWAKRERLIEINPTVDVEKSKIVKTGGFRVWTEAESETYVAKHPLGSKAYLASQIMACTSFRRSTRCIRAAPCAKDRRASARRDRRISAAEGLPYGRQPSDGTDLSRSGGGHCGDADGGR